MKLEIAGRNLPSVRIAFLWLAKDTRRQGDHHRFAEQGLPLFVLEAGVPSRKLSTIQAMK